MRNTKCRNVRRDIEEAGSNDFLSAAAHEHIQSCQTCATLAGKQSSLSALMSSLGTIEAPGDFDFRLRARLASERRAAGPVTGGTFSFGFRLAAVAVALVAAAAFMLVSYRNNQISQPSVASNSGNSGNSANPEASSAAPAGDVVQKANPSAVAIAASPTEGNAVEINPGRSATPKRQVVTARAGNRVGTRDVSSTQAAVLKRYNELAETYPDASFPINASNQSLKVSVDDGRGSFRTISLPTVSFGSQRTVSKDATPLMASARGVW